MTLILAENRGKLKEPITTAYFHKFRLRFFTFVKNVCFNLLELMSIVVIGVIRSMHF